MGRSKSVKGRERSASCSSFSARELCEKISRIYEISPNKQFKSQVELALKRGVNYGLLRKIRNKYRYEASPPKDSLTLGKKTKPRKRGVRITKASSSKTSTKPGQQQQQQPEPERRYNVPRPTVPPPPNWNQKPRHLPTEPYPKIMKKRR